MNARTIVVATLFAATSTLAFAGEANDRAATESSAGTGIYHVVSMAPGSTDYPAGAPQAIETPAGTGVYYTVLMGNGRPDTGAEAPGSTDIAMTRGVSQAAVADWIGGSDARRVANR